MITRPVPVDEEFLFIYRIEYHIKYPYDIYF